MEIKHKTGFRLTYLIAAAGWLLALASFTSLFFMLRSPGITFDTSSRDRYYLLTGDEPHYLLIAHSLAFDGDVDLFNNKRNHDYDAYYHRSVSGYVKNRDYWTPFVQGHVRNASDEYWNRRAYSICPIGMPALIAPAYKLGFLIKQRVRFTVALYLMILSALLACTGIWLSWRLTKGDWFATIVAGVCLPLSAPLIYYTSQIYSDLPAGLFIATAFWLIIRLTENPSIRADQNLRLLCLGLILGGLLWLHTKFWLHTTLLLVCAIVELKRLSRSPRPLDWLWLILPLGISLAGVSWYHYLLFGVPLPVSTHPGIVVTKAFWNGWPGLWFDRDGGLLFYTPFTALFFAAVILLWRNRNRVGLWMALLVLTHWLAVGVFPDWRGGRCPPLRYWAPVAILFAPICATVVASVKKKMLRVLFVLLAMAGIWFGVAGMLHPGKLYRYRHPVLHRQPALHYAGLTPRFDGRHPLQTALTTTLALLLLTELTIIIVRSYPVERPARRRSDQL